MQYSAKAVKTRKPKNLMISAVWTGLEPAASGVTGRLLCPASGGGVLQDRQKPAAFGQSKVATGHHRTPEDAFQYTHSIPRSVLLKCNVVMTML